MANDANLELDGISTKDEVKAEIDHLHWAIVDQSDVERILEDTEKQVHSDLVSYCYIEVSYDPGAHFSSIVQSEKLNQFFQSTRAEVKYGPETQQPSPGKHWHIPQILVAVET